MSRSFALKGAGLATVVLALAIASPAMAEMEVIESNVATYAKGATYPNDAVFKLEAGQRVKVLVKPANVTKVFEGKGSHQLPEPIGGPRSPTGKKKTE